uniref:Speckle-type POZ protein (inferred by orthology to a human protein) n=1 Tax=Strongyloides venezuelensis TaxID=75913 RepID=A0A0K0FGF2_STRVS
MSSTNSSSESDGKFSTKKIIEKDSFTWTIEKFSYCELIKNKTTKSPLFTSKRNGTIKWSLNMFPKEVCSYDEDRIIFWLELEKADCIELTALFSFYFLNADGEKKHKKVMNIMKLNKTKRRCFCHRFLEHDFLLSADNNELLPNGDLIVGCEIFHFHDAINTDDFSTNNSINESLNVLLNDIAVMCESPKFSDCVIKVGDSKISVHKFILVSRSEVFNSILTDKQYESNLNIIEINGFRLEIVKEMITYLYTGKSPNIYKMAIEMLQIGEKYKLQRLKLIAEESLIHSLYIGNACDYLLFSELYSAETLQKWCLRFIYFNVEKVINTEKWKVVVSDYPLLVAKLFNIAAKNNNTAKWPLLLYPKEGIINNESFISLELLLEEVDCIELTVLCSFYVLNEYVEKKT